MAFQLTNFLRDVGEDLDRGRVYLPADLLARYGVDRDLLVWCRAHRRGHRGCGTRSPTGGVEPGDLPDGCPGHRDARPGVASLRRTAFTLYRGFSRRDSTHPASTCGAVGAPCRSGGACSRWRLRLRPGHAARAVSGRRANVGWRRDSGAAENRGRIDDAESMGVRRLPLRRLPKTRWEQQEPSWQEARPALIEGALKRALARPSGNWFVLAASLTGYRRPGQPFGRMVAGVEVVAWRSRDNVVHAAPGSCPHLGAPLCRGAVRGDRPGVPVAWPVAGAGRLSRVVAIPCPR